MFACTAVYFFIAILHFWQIQCPSLSAEPLVPLQGGGGGSKMCDHPLLRLGFRILALGVYNGEEVERRRQLLVVC